MKRLRACAAIVLICFAVIALCQRQAVGVPQVAQTPPSMAASKEDVAQLKEKVANLEGKIDSTQTAFSITVGLLVLILMIGTGVSFVSFYKAEKRSTEAFNIAKNAEGNMERRTEASFNLWSKGETSAQDRAAATHEQFFESSGRTLSLVNDTLELAKQASERAAQAIEKRARDLLADYDDEAKQLIENAAAEADDRHLVSNLSVRSDLRSLAKKINGFENSSLFLPVDIGLTPYCQFVRAMDFHLEQQIKDALKTWLKVAVDDQAPPTLQSQAWYWIGYERNNIGLFRDAEKAFGNALKGATGGRRYELMRIQIESQFFNTKSDDQLDDIIAQLEKLREMSSEDRTATDIKKREGAVLRTLGNVLMEAAAYQQKRNAATSNAYVNKAQAAFESAFAIDNEDMWAMFGLAQVCEMLGDTPRANRLLSDVTGLVQKESVNREEPRTKVLCRTTELICCTHAPEQRDAALSTYNHVIEALGRVDGRLTVYSQFRKRNIPKDDFRIEVEEYARRNGVFARKRRAVKK